MRGLPSGEWPACFGPGAGVAWVVIRTCAEWGAYTCFGPALRWRVANGGGEANGGADRMSRLAGCVLIIGPWWAGTSVGGCSVGPGPWWPVVARFWPPGGRFWPVAPPGSWPPCFATISNGRLPS